MRSNLERIMREASLVDGSLELMLHICVKIRTIVLGKNPTTGPQSVNTVFIISSCGDAELHVPEFCMNCDNNDGKEDLYNVRRFLSDVHDTRE